MSEKVIEVIPDFGPACASDKDCEEIAKEIEQELALTNSCEVQVVTREGQERRARDRNRANKELAAAAENFYNRALLYKMEDKLPRSIMDAWSHFEAAIMAWRESKEQRRVEREREPMETEEGS